MIAVDTNILVYAHRRDSDFHRPARQALQTLAGGKGSWAIPWPCLHEFLAIVTHPRIYSPPSTPTQAADQVDAWLQSPSVHMIGETADYWPTIRRQLVDGKVTGPLVHDARVAAVCMANGVRQLWSADRDFGRFGDLDVHNPLVPRS
ncbi:MAG TPA: TA system VapC family ribonuclease toxin [Acidothermales bacterium]